MDGDGAGAADRELLEYARGIFRELTREKKPAGEVGDRIRPDPGLDCDTGAYRDLVEELSPRELEILDLISRGLSNREISEKLFLTVGTVKWHTGNIYGKLGVRSRTRAVAWARELNLLPY